MDYKITKLIILIIGAFILSALSIPQILKIVLGKQIFDTPGGRKIHKQNTPSMGGIGVFFSFVLLAMVFVHESEYFMSQYYYFSMVLLFFTGMRDDLIPIRSLHKFLLQIVAALIIAGMSEIRITSIYSVAGLYDLILPEWLSFSFTIFFIVAMTNAFNLIDGIDGLAGSVALISISALMMWFAVNGFWSFAFLCGIMLGAVIGFIYYNWSPARIFMGDTGSLIIGFFCSSMFIVFLNLNKTATIFRIDNSVSFIAVLFIYPIYDIMRVFWIRLKRKRSPFSPDKLHIHLLLRRIGLEHHQISILISILSIALLLMFFILSALNISEFFIFLFIVFYCIVLNILLHKKISEFTKNKQPIIVKKFRGRK